MTEYKFNGKNIPCLTASKMVVFHEKSTITLTLKNLSQVEKNLVSSQEISEVLIKSKGKYFYVNNLILKMLEQTEDYVATYKFSTIQDITRKIKLKKFL